MCCIRLAVVILPSDGSVGQSKTLSLTKSRVDGTSSHEHNAVERHNATNSSATTSSLGCILLKLTAALWFCEFDAYHRSKAD